MIPNHGEVMQETQTPPTEPVVQVPVMVAAELQDSLLVVMRDLQRLVGLLDHATSNLMARFSEANGLLNDGVELGSNTAELEAARTALRSAVTELQFHDMATQLIKKGSTKKAYIRTSGVNTFWGIPAGGVAAAAVTNRTNVTSVTISYNQART